MSVNLWRHGRGNILKLLELIERGNKSAVGFLGKLVGTCCCCGMTLKAKQSLQNGFGPVCAKRFKLSDMGSCIRGYEIGDHPVIYLSPHVQDDLIISHSDINDISYDDDDEEDDYDEAYDESYNDAAKQMSIAMQGGEEDERKDDDKKF
jgi:hypothetical protein